MSGIGELPDIGTGDTFPKQQLNHLIAFKGGARNNKAQGMELCVFDWGTAGYRHRGHISYIS